jgi:hypothetical protein
MVFTDRVGVAAVGNVMALLIGAWYHPRPRLLQRTPGSVARMLTPGWRLACDNAENHDGD